MMFRNYQAFDYYQPHEEYVEEIRIQKLIRANELITKGNCYDQLVTLMQPITVPDGAGTQVKPLSKEQLDSLIKYAKEKHSEERVIAFLQSKTFLSKSNEAVLSIPGYKK